MQALTAGQAQVVMAVTAQYVNVMIGNNAGAYTFRQGAKMPTTVENLRGFVASGYENATHVVFDAAALIQAVNFVNDMDRLDGFNGKKAIKLIVEGGSMKVVSGSGEKADTVVTPLAIQGGDVSMGLNGVKLRQILDVVDRGNVTLTFEDSLLVIENGTIADGTSDSVLAFLMKVAESSAEDAQTSDAEEESGD